MPLPPRCALAACLVFVTGCPGEPEGAGDAGAVDGALATDAMAVIAPERVAPPMLGPCAEGWREVVGDPATCEPWPASGRKECATGEAHFPGSAACETIGTPCTEDPWASDLPAEASVRYVRAGAAAGGDGTRDTPFATIASALVGARAGDVIALSKGTFDEAVTVPSGITLWGACTAETRVASSAPSSMLASVDLRGRDAAIRNLQIGGARLGVIAQAATTAARLEGVLVTRAVGVGIAAANGATLTASDLVITDVAPMPDGTFGRGIDIELGSSLDATRLVVARAHEFGVFVTNGGSSVTLGRAAIIDTFPSAADGTFGRAMRVEDGAVLEGSVLTIEGNADVSVSASRAGVVRITDAVVRDTQPSASGGYGRAFDAYREGRIELGRVLVERNREVAINVDGPGSSMRLEDVVVRDTLPHAVDEAFGRAISAQDGARIELFRVFASDSAEYGVFCVGAASELHAEDLRVARIAPRVSDSELGRGVQVQEGCTAVLARAEIVEAHEVALMATDLGTSVRATDVTVRDTRSRATDGTLGRGLHAQDLASVRIERALFERNRETGVHAAFAGTRVELSHVVVRDTLPRACAESSCVGFGAGVGLGAYVGGRIVADQFTVLRSALAGVQIARGGQMDLADGLIAENPVGANVQVSGYDHARLSTRVVYRDNDVDLDATALPVPEPEAAR